MAYTKRVLAQVKVDLRIDGSPHVGLANLHASDEAALRFFRDWRELFIDLPPLDEFTHPVLGRVREQRLFADEVLAPFVVRPKIELLRKAWRGDKNALRELTQTVNQSGQAGLRFKDGQIFLEIEGWPVIAAAFLSDYEKGDIAICQQEGKGCLTPQFVKKRSTQIYCSDACRDDVLRRKNKECAQRRRDRAKRKKK